MKIIFHARRRFLSSPSLLPNSTNTAHSTCIVHKSAIKIAFYLRIKGLRQQLIPILHGRKPQPRRLTLNSNRLFPFLHSRERHCVSIGLFRKLVRKHVDFFNDILKYSQTSVHSTLSVLTWGVEWREVQKVGRCSRIVSAFSVPTKPVECREVQKLRRCRIWEVSLYIHCLEDFCQLNCHLLSELFNFLDNCLTSERLLLCFSLFSFFSLFFLSFLLYFLEWADTSPHDSTRYVALLPP